ncbi:MAG: YggS family pyridoxal phosphate-dependent enzyme [Rikenellaceae bacterium]|nr:YggS family pyridoxal phosphate-dependent enzyme [Rikenellaceae bacterium]
MSVTTEIKRLHDELPESVTLVAVSKTHPAEAIAEAYEAGQRIFGESRPQELRAKWECLPQDIEWHMIGHLQTNKVRMIAPFVALIHSVDSLRLLRVIDSEARRINKVIDVLLEVHISAEESKEGWNPAELEECINQGEWREMSGVRIRGLMCVATNTDDTGVVRGDFCAMHELFLRYREVFGSEFDTLSMGMSDDYTDAIACGSTMVRIGSTIFGNRYYPPRA